METENNNNFETVLIEGQLWAVTASGEETSAEQVVTTNSVSPDVEEVGQVEQGDTSETAGQAEDAVESSEAENVAAVSNTAAEPEAASVELNDTQDETEFDALQALTSLLVGGAIEGTSQLTTRLQYYQEALRQEAAERDAADAIDEDELVRLRYALVGLIFDAQATLRRNVSLWARLADQSARATNRVAQPVTNSFLFGPARRRYERFIRRGEESLARWIADGRKQEPPSRELAFKTYTELVDEFIDKLAENPQLQAVITKQSLGVASDMRDEVRERTVTADNVMEGLVRRILRRTPRAQLPEPPPEVQRWAGLTIEEYRAQLKADEAENESS